MNERQADRAVLRAARRLVASKYTWVIVAAVLVGIAVAVLV